MRKQSRRQFLIHAAGAGAAFAAAGLWRGLGASPLGKPVGIQLWTVNDTLKHDPAGTLNQLGKIGFKEVEAAGFAGLAPKEFRRLLDAAGLRCPSAHLQFDMDNLGKAFDEAHALGASYAAASSLIEPVGKAMSTKLEWKSAMGREEAKRTVDVANRIGEAAKRAGLQFALHNHDREFIDLGNGEVGYDIVWRDTDPKLVQFEIDCGWMVFAGRNPVDYFKKYPGRIPLIHVKDFQPKKNPNGAPMSEQMLGSELGRGTVDYRPIFAAAKAAGLKHYFAEQEGPFSRMSQLEAAQVAYDYLHSIS
ncbi:MAG: sugar phosphate isomerase/epimerase [Proteobacteria bacterium]|uniref:sugar phosphate isomerase/epimerase family protein n=1 Tax=Rudaea sp. TaxID=2136325 RepID=UPI003784E794|nr:sugar phosphate isomerase/epimerase [Pseudomonadota bacterium]